jgi:hypothetical protein
MEWIAEAGVGVLAVSWYPQGMADSQGRSWEALIPVLLDEADKFGMKITLHIEPYKERTAASLRTDLQFIHEHYGSHPAFYRAKRAGQITETNVLDRCFGEGGKNYGKIQILVQSNQDKCTKCVSIV